MYNLYFKLSDSEKIYMRSMQYMTTLDSKGNEYVEFYHEEKFISVNEFFKNADYIGKYAQRVKPVQCGEYSDISYTDEDNFVMLYATNKFGIGYDIDTNSYDFITEKYMRDYKTNGWQFGKECTPCVTKPEEIVRTVLKETLDSAYSKNNKVNKEMAYNYNKLERMKTK